MMHIVLFLIELVDKPDTYFEEEIPNILSCIRKVKIPVKNEK